MTTRNASRRRRLLHIVWITALVFVCAKPDGTGAAKAEAIHGGGLLAYISPGHR